MSLSESDGKTLQYAERWKWDLQDALDYVESNGKAGNFDGLFGSTSCVFSTMSARCKHLDFSPVTRLYESFKNYRSKGLGYREIKAMADEAVITVNAGIDQIVADAKKPPTGKPDLDGNSGLIDTEGAAKLLHRSANTLRKYRSQWPKPKVEAAGRASAKWSYYELLPKLREQFPGVNLPDEYPSDQ